MAADLVLIIHFCIVFFVTFGLIAVPIGYLRNYTWTRNMQMRVVHMLFMGFITVEAILGITCPLTIIENILRHIEYQQSFVSYWISRFIYWNLPANFFIILYTSCFIWSVIFWRVHPPIYPNRKWVFSDWYVVKIAFTRQWRNHPEYCDLNEKTIRESSNRCMLLKDLPVNGCRLLLPKKNRSGLTRAVRQ